MRLMKLMNKMPYLLYVAVLQLGLYCSLTIVYGGLVYSGGSLSRPRFWILLLPVLLLISLYALVRARFSLQAKGLNYTATFGELDEAMKRDKVSSHARLNFGFWPIASFRYCAAAVFGSKANFNIDGWRHQERRPLRERRCDLSPATPAFPRKGVRTILVHLSKSMTQRSRGFITPEFCVARLEKKRAQGTPGAWLHL
jgi:hypothetical protein